MLTNFEGEELPLSVVSSISMIGGIELGIRFGQHYPTMVWAFRVLHCIGKTSNDLLFLKKRNYFVLPGLFSNLRKLGKLHLSCDTVASSLHSLFVVN